jgi:hypothetical protein
MKIGPAIILILLITACATQRRCLEKYPPISHTDTLYAELIRDSLIYRDTLILITVPGDTIKDTLYIKIKPGYFHSDTLTLETEFARASAFYQTPSIHMTLVQKEATFARKLDSVIRIEKHWKEMYTTITQHETTITNVVPKIYKAAAWLWILVFVMILGAIVFRIAKIKLPF